eukprot:TRINITY_DN14006_c0_g1_i1.p1 TRINITY_DN14006_c0_g1~~TRINITY_DN14006_c0_g1_i1.p1  ORF type:complete len:674 (-),score=31.85 TRINITY_DN14006_c0_g1_i1:141-2075(-)
MAGRKRKRTPPVPDEMLFEFQIAGAQSSARANAVDEGMGPYTMVGDEGSLIQEEGECRGAYATIEAIGDSPLSVESWEGSGSGGGDIGRDLLREGSQGRIMSDGRRMVNESTAIDWGREVARNQTTSGGGTGISCALESSGQWHEAEAAQHSSNQALETSAVFIAGHACSCPDDKLQQQRRSTHQYHHHLLEQKTAPLPPAHDSASMRPASEPSISGSATVSAISPQLYQRPQFSAPSLAAHASTTQCHAPMCTQPSSTSARDHSLVVDFSASAQGLKRNRPPRHNSAPPPEGPRIGGVARRCSAVEDDFQRNSSSATDRWSELIDRGESCTGRGVQSDRCAYTSAEHDLTPVLEHHRVGPGVPDALSSVGPAVAWDVPGVLSPREPVGGPMQLDEALRIVQEDEGGGMQLGRCKTESSLVCANREIFLSRATSATQADPSPRELQEKRKRELLAQRQTMKKLLRVQKELQETVRTIIPEMQMSMMTQGIVLQLSTGVAIAEWLPTKVLGAYNGDFVAASQWPPALLDAGGMTPFDLITPEYQQVGREIMASMAMQGVVQFSMVDLWIVRGVRVPMYLRLTLRPCEGFADPLVVVHSSPLRSYREEQVWAPQDVQYAPSTATDEVDHSVPSAKRRKTNTDRDDR